MFVDESKARSFLFVAVMVAPYAVHLLRRELRDARPKGRRDIHFNGARDDLRDAVVRILERHEIKAVVLRAVAAKGCNPVRTVSVRQRGSPFQSPRIRSCWIETRASKRKIGAGSSRSCTRAAFATTICTVTRSRFSGRRTRLPGVGSAVVLGRTRCVRSSFGRPTWRSRQRKARVTHLTGRLPGSLLRAIAPRATNSSVSAAPDNRWGGGSAARPVP